MQLSRHIASFSNSRARAHLVSSAGGGAGSVNTELTRLDAGSGTTLVSSTLLLPATGDGAVSPGGSNKIRLLIGGNEEPIYVQELDGRHLNGNLKAVLVQASRSLTNGSPLAATFEIGAATRNTANDLSYTDPARYDNTPPSGSYKNAHPPGFFNFEPSYLAACQTFVDFPLRYQGQSGETAYDADYFVTYQWAEVDGGNLPGGAGNDIISTTGWDAWNGVTVDGTGGYTNQYDAGFEHYVMWLLTGNAEYFRRSCCLTTWFVHEYLRANGPYTGIAPWMATPMGILAAYWATGESFFRGEIATFAQARTDSAGLIPTGNIDDFESEPRPIALQLLIVAAAKMVGDTSRDWDAVAGSILSGWFGGNGWITSGANDGAYWNQVMYSGCTSGSANEKTQNFMLAMLFWGIYAVYTYCDNADLPSLATTEARVTGLLDFLDTQYRSGDTPTPSYQYNNNTTCDGGGLHATVDLNGMFAAGYALMGRMFDNGTWKSHGDTLYETITRSPHDGFSGPFLLNSRTIHEAYAWSWVCPAIREGA